MEFSEVLLKDIYRLVKEEGHHPMSVVSQLGEIWGYNRRERGELFAAYAKYCEKVAKTS